MNLKTWYSGMKIPSFVNRSATEKFVTSTLGLFLSMIDDKKTYPDIVLSDDIDTGAVSFEEKKVFLSRKYIDPDPMNRLNHNASEEASMTAMIGTCIHEFNHIRLTQISPKELWNRQVPKIDECAFLEAIFQIVEDIYIDSFGFEIITTRWIFEARQNYLFTHSDYDAAAKEMPNEIKSVEDFANAINVLVFLKNFSIPLHPINSLHQALIKMFLGSQHINSVDDRFAHAAKIRDFMIKDIPKEETSDYQKKESEGGENDGDIESAIEMLSKMLISNFVQTASHQKELSKPGKQLEKIIKNFNSDGRVNLIELKASDFEKVGFYVSKVRSGTCLDKLDTRYSEFANMIQARTLVNRPYGMQSNRGRNIRQLYRIASDCKIFAERVEFDGIGPQEIIFLLDCSGSMGSNDKDTKSIQAVFAAVQGLQNSRHRVAVYGHSADIRINFSKFNVVVYCFKDFDDSIDNLRNQFDYYYKNGHSMQCSNNDEFAVEYVVGKFSTIPNKKTLIIVSDGVPSGSLTTGVGSTARKISSIRNHLPHIKIVSISIDRAAFQPNNKIYGSDNNFCNEDPNVVLNVIESICES
jgi:hypothetical protein